MSNATNITKSLTSIIVAGGYEDTIIDTKNCKMKLHLYSHDRMMHWLSRPT